MSTATYSADPPRLHTGQGESRKRTAIYCRVSHPGQKNTTSLPEQERINRAHAAMLGWQVSEAHVYHEVEGGQDLYRPQMDRLWDAIIRHEIDAVVIHVLDRLSRDEGDCDAFDHHCDRYGVTVELAPQRTSTRPTRRATCSRSRA